LQLVALLGDTSGGTVAGTIQIADSGNPNASPAGLWVGVAQAPPSSENSADFQLWEKNFQYWVKSDANGNFTIPNVIASANYTLFAFGPGAIGTFQSQSLTGTALSTVNVPATPFSVTVVAGATNNLGNVTWTPARVGPTVWEIGVPDRTAKEFRHGDNYFHGYVWTNFVNEFPNPLNYYVGKSNWKTDWNYAQTRYAGPGGTNAVLWKVAEPAAVFFVLSDMYQPPEDGPGGYDHRAAHEIDVQVRVAAGHTPVFEDQPGYRRLK